MFELPVSPAEALRSNQGDTAMFVGSFSQVHLGGWKVTVGNATCYIIIGISVVSVLWIKFSLFLADVENDKLFENKPGKKKKNKERKHVDHSVILLLVQTYSW